MTDRDELMTAAGAYALGALAEPEKSEFEALMAESEQLRAEVTELMDTAVELGLSVAPVDPSPAIARPDPGVGRRRPRSSPAAGRGAPRSDASRNPGRAQGPLPLEHAAGSARRRRRGGRPRRQPRVHGPRRHPGAERHGDGLADQRDPGRADDYQRESVEITGGGTATLVWSVALERSALIVDGLQGLPAGSTYELWYIDEDGATPAGTFDVGDDGKRSVVLAGDMDAGRHDRRDGRARRRLDIPSTDPVIVVETA